MTTRQLLVALSLALICSVSAFQIRPTSSSAGFGNYFITKTTSLNAMAVSSSILHPITRLLPWEKEKEEARQAKAMRLEGAKLYRTLGVTEDATYEEITQATDELIIKYASDIKQKTRVQVTKDKIMDLRLRQRVSGNLGVSGEAREMDIMDEKRAEIDKQRKKWSPPGWTKGVVVLPDKKHLKSTSSYLGGTGLGIIMLPNLATSFIMLASMCSLGLLYNRGSPEMPKDEFGQAGEVRSPNPVSVGLTVGLVFGWAAIMAVVSTVLMGMIPNIARRLPENLIVNLAINLGFWIAATGFKTYRD